MKLVNLYWVAVTGLLVCTFSAHGQQGSTNVEKRVDSILSQMTLDEKLSYISGVGFPTSPGVFNIKPIPHLGLPEIFGSDGTLGIVGQGTPPGLCSRRRGIPIAPLR